MGTKICKACGMDKPTTEFHRHKDSFQSKCKPCKAKVDAEYRSKNQDKIKANRRKYYDAKSEQIRAKSKAYYDDNRDKVLASQREYHFRNIDSRKAYRKQHYWNNVDYYKNSAQQWRVKHKDYASQRDREYRLKKAEQIRIKSKIRYESMRASILLKEKCRRQLHRERILSTRREDYRNNRAKHDAWRQNRRARLRNAGGTVTRKDIDNLAKIQRNLCACCLKDIRSGYHIDHIIPLKLGGDNSPQNIQLLCAPCNLSKQARHPVDFMQERGYLL